MGKLSWGWGFKRLDLKGTKRALMTNALRDKSGLGPDVDQRMQEKPQAEKKDTTGKTHTHPHIAATAQSSAELLEKTQQPELKFESCRCPYVRPMGQVSLHGLLVSSTENSPDFTRGRGKIIERPGESRCCLTSFSNTVRECLHGLCSCGHQGQELFSMCKLFIQL